MTGPVVGDCAGFAVGLAVGKAVGAQMYLGLLYSVACTGCICNRT